MDTDRSQILSAHLDRALDLTPSERLRFLADLRQGDTALAEQLESLLEDDRRSARRAFLLRMVCLAPRLKCAAGAGDRCLSIGCAHRRRRHVSVRIMFKAVCLQRLRPSLEKS